jgi:hypothetical protein
MTVMTKMETENWLRSKSVEEIDGNFKNYRLGLAKEIPVDSGVKNYIANEISKLSFGKLCLFYIDEYGIWPSSQNMYLFDGFRKSVGITDTIYEKPGHLVSSEEKIDLYCLIAMVLYFSWGALLVSETGEEIIRISHDEIIDVYVATVLETSEMLTGIDRILGNSST